MLALFLPIPARPLSNEPLIFPAVLVAEAEMRPMPAVKPEVLAVIATETVRGTPTSFYAERVTTNTDEPTSKRKGSWWSAVFPLVAVVAVIAGIAGCQSALSNGSDEGSTSGYQTAVRKACADQVRNRIGQATFRNQSETSSAGAAGATTYVAKGRADVAGQSVSYTCEGSVSADSGKTLTVRLTSMS